ncbi:MAG: glutathione S-transferase [Brucellaceae bacterium]|jgi:glutathione S-transferase|nr:glutathione S-transferase [Brucellaceae bacterium]
MYTLYIANKNYSTWSLRPWLLMTQLEIPFEEVLIPFGSADWSRNPSPTAQVPCLSEPQQDGSIISVWDSLAITEYLADNHSQVWPQNKKARAWARCATAEMHSGFHTLRSICTNNIGLRIDISAKLTPVLQRDISRIEQLWTEGLETFGGPFLAGSSFSAVDAFFAPVAFRFQTYGIKLNDTAAAYADYLRSLPAMQDWYAASLAEVWRDEPHEQDARNAGPWLQDLRAV